MHYIFIKYLQYYIYNNFYIDFDHYTSSKRRSSTSKVFFKIGVLKSLIIFTEKHLYWSFVLEACNFFETKIPAQKIVCVFAKFLRTSILQDICERLFLKKEA